MLDLLPVPLYNNGERRYKTMDINTLDKVIDTYKSDVTAYYTEMSDEPAKYSDINEVAKLTLYALNDFKKEIINYLKSN